MGKKIINILLGVANTPNKIFLHFCLPLSDLKCLWLEPGPDSDAFHWHFTGRIVLVLGILALGGLMDLKLTLSELCCQTLSELCCQYYNFGAKTTHVMISRDIVVYRRQILTSKIDPRTERVNTTIPM